MGSLGNKNMANMYKCVQNVINVHCVAKYYMKYYCCP